jgi:hypothetical protein
MRDSSELERASASLNVARTPLSSSRLGSVALQ